MLSFCALLWCIIFNVNVGNFRMKSVEEDLQKTGIVSSELCLNPAVVELLVSDQPADRSQQAAWSVSVRRRKLVAMWNAMCCVLGTVWEPISEISSHAAVPSRLAEPLWTDWPEEWNWCTRADLCCKKSTHKNCAWDGFTESSPVILLCKAEASALW